MKHKGWQHESARHSLAARGMKTTCHKSRCAPSKSIRVGKKEKEESLARLKPLFKPGDKVYTVLTHVARSGMSRNIKVYKVKNGEMLDISYDVAKVLELPQADDGGVKIGGAGMDMGFEIVYLLGHALYPKGFKTPAGYWRNEPMAFDPDGGYALKQEWR